MPIINLDEILGETVYIVYKGQKYEMAEADEEDFLRLGKWGELADKKDADALKTIRSEVQDVLKRLLPDFPWEQERLPFPALVALVISLSGRLGEQMKAAGAGELLPKARPTSRPVEIPLQPPELPSLT